MPLTYSWSLPAGCSVSDASPAGSYDAYFTDVLTQVSGGPVRTYGWKASDYSITLLDTHTHDGNSWTVDGQTISVSTKSGRLVSITGANQAARDSALTAAIADVQPGDTIVCDAGTYTGKYDPNSWNNTQFVLNSAESGTASQPVHLTAAAGASVVFDRTGSSAGNFYAGRLDVAERCDYWNVSALYLKGTEDNIYGGGVTSDDAHPESGGRFWRVVGCTAERTNNDNNVGQFEWEGDGWIVLGNTFLNPLSGTINNQAHAIYVDNGADNCEIAYNRFVERREGFIVMFHQDGTAMQYDNNWVHHNYFQPHGGAGSGNARGFSHSNVSDTSTCLVEDNYFDGVGISGDFGPMMIYRGLVTSKRNHFENCVGNANMETDTLMGGSRHLYYGQGADANTSTGALGMFAGAAGDRSGI